MGEQFEKKGRMFFGQVGGADRPDPMRPFRKGTMRPEDSIFTSCPASLRPDSAPADAPCPHRMIREDYDSRTAEIELMCMGCGAHRLITKMQKQLHRGLLRDFLS